MLRKRLRGDLDTIVLKALSKAPADRYATVNAFAEDIERFLQGRPVQARPASRLYRARKFAGLNRIAVSAAAVVCLAVVAGAGFATWQARLARAEQARAEAVKDFIASIFRDVDPNLRGEARPLTAVEVLSLARDCLETQLTTAPDVRFELRRILGDSLVAVGDPAKAADVLTRALAEASSVHDDESTLIETELLLAEAQQYLAKTTEADQHLASSAGGAGTHRTSSNRGVRRRPRCCARKSWSTPAAPRHRTPKRRRAKRSTPPHGSSGPVTRCAPRPSGT